MPPTLNLISKPNRRVSLRGTVAALPSSQRSREAIYKRQEKRSKAELFQMLAEAVRNTQPAGQHAT